MKKWRLLILLSVFVLFLFALSFSASAVLDSLPKGDDPNQIMTSVTGVNVDVNKIPKNADDFDNISSNYLYREWGKVISKWPVVGPIHLFLVAHPVVFKVLFATPYDFTMTFFLVLALWLIIAFQIGSLFFSGIFYFKNRWTGWLIGVLMAIMVAQSGLLNIISETTLTIVQNRSYAWVRFLIWIGVAVLVVAANYLSSLVRKSVVGTVEQRRKSELAHSQNMINAAAQGLREK